MLSLKRDLEKSSLTALIVGFSALLILFVWALVLYELGEERERAIRDAYKDATTYASALTEHSGRTLQSADQTALFLKYQFETNGKSFDMAQYLSTGVVLGDIFNLLSITDEKSDVIMSSKPFTPVNLSDREHIRVHFAGDTGKLFVGKPVLGRVSGKWSMQMTRRINKPDGTFGGVVVVSMDPFYFSRFYQDVSIGARGSIAMVGADGVVRARQSGSESSVGQSVAGSDFMRAIASGDRGTYEGRSSIDGTQRYFAFRKLDHYPIYIVVGIANDDVMTSLNEYRKTLGSLALIITIIVLIFAVLTIRLIRQLETSRERAIEASEAKSRFLANMSHELRTPLNGILGYAELLQSDLKGSEQESFATAIRQSGAHLLNLVNAVLDIGKVEDGKVDLNWENVPLQQLLSECIQAHASSAGIKNLSLDLQLAPTLPANIESDRTRLTQVLNNLIHNAIKFTDNGTVTVLASPEQNDIVFEIRDSGIGIEAAKQSMVFERFVQADSSDSRAHGGSGLGLALAKELIELMGGRIWLVSKPGEGSSFFFVIPSKQNIKNPEVKGS